MAITLLFSVAYITGIKSSAHDAINALHNKKLDVAFAGCKIEKVSLAISLAIRFIPVLVSITAEVRAAQRVRGLERNIFAIAMPVIIRTLKMGNEIAEALDARSFGATEKDDPDHV